VHLSKLSARAGLLAVATALVTALVAAPGAGAATFSGGSIKIDFKSLKGVKMTPKGHSSKTSTSATFPFRDESAAVTMNAQASGNINIGKTSDSITLTRGKKKIVLQSLVQKLKSGAGTLSAKVSGKGKLIDFFTEASANRIVVDGGFTTLTLQTANTTLTKAGAAALNKAFGLKAPARGKKDQRLKNKAKVGTASFTADRRLEFGSGSTNTTFDQTFFDALKNNCDIDLAASGTAQPVPAGPTAARGGAILNVIGGAMNAKTLSGNIQHDAGGTSLDRKEGSSKGAAYHTDIISYEFVLDQVPPIIRAFSTAVVNTVPIGTLEGGTLSASLTDTGGTVTMANGVLKLSDAAGQLLKLQTGCDIPVGSTLAVANTTANVK
jgi:hypothetical protein